MIIGVDFDNTIVCYDVIFHRVALERGLIPADLPADKASVRNHLRKIGREPDWTEIQGYVYGPRLGEANPYPGVLEFFQAAARQGIELRIISHKTRHPFLGEKHDLHAAAWGWLEAQGFFDPARIGIRREQVFLELTKESKHQRIGAAGCTHFIDDLPEFLLDPGFPEGVERIHFDPNESEAGGEQLRAATSWQQLGTELLTRSAVLALAGSVLAAGPLEAARLPGGANNRLFHVSSPSGDVVVKAYHHSAADQRDRFAAEQHFYRLGLPQTPEALGWDAENRLGVFTRVHGRKLAAQEIAAAEVEQCVAWICEVQGRGRAHPAAAQISAAADACFSTEEHVALLEHRVRRLVEAESDDAGFRSFLQDELAPHAARLATSIRAWDGPAAVVPGHRILSPSDFGFHNALQDAAGRIWFFDFEYAGWDDPAKLLCDFFCQPQVPVRLDHADRFLSALRNASGDTTLEARFRLLLPLHAAKWACILLNEFLRNDAERRRFAGVEDRRSVQLEKARRMLAQSHSFC
jgi:hypothetical protein